MKLNISKLQQGGEISAPWVGYSPFFQPIEQQSGQSPSSTKGSSKNAEDSTLKQVEKVLGEMTGKGLTNEVNYFSQRVGNLLADSTLLGQPMSVREYSAIISQLNEIQNNKQIFDEAKKHAIDKGTLSETAVTYDGNLYAQTKEGTLQLVTPYEYNEHRDKYRLLTNNDLLTLRNNSNNMIFDKTLSQTVLGSLSVSDINKEIDEAIKMIQKEDTSSDLYINKTKANQFDQGLQSLINSKLGMAPDNELYKVTSTVSTQRNHIDTALNRIWEKLPQHAKNTLIAHTAINEAGNPRENAIKALGDLLVYGTYHKEGMEIKGEGALDTSGNKKSGSGSGTPSELNPFEIYAGAEKTQDYEVTLGSEYSYKTKANIAPLVGSDKKLLNNNYLSTIITNGGIGALVDPNGASLGTGQALSSADLTKILYADAQVASAWLPSMKDANGSKVVDLASLNRLKDADTEIRSIPNITEMQKNEIYKKHNVEHLVIKGNPTQQQLSYMSQFLIIPSYIPEEVAEKVGLDNLIEKLPKEQEEEAQELYSQIRSRGINKDIRSSSFEPGQHWWWWDDDIYKSSVFLPMSDNIMMRSLVGGNAPLVDKDRLFYENMQRNQKQLNTQSGGINLQNTLGIN